MAKKKGFRHLRTCVQAAWTFLSNCYAVGFAEGKIYTGPLKNICFPGLNCYSCPGAVGACPIGSLQAVMGSWKFSVSLYVGGFLMLVGALLGRFVCGWLCPFGLVQDLLYKIPFIRKINRFPGDKVLRYLKYVILLVFVILMPLFVVDIVGQGAPAFCKYICPSGTLLGGIPLVFKNPGLQAMVGFLFRWKVAILLVTVFLSILIYRPFCKYICPLGATYALFNRASLYRLRVDKNQCVNCGLCAKTCKMGVDPVKTPNSAECIRCGDCARACPKNAIHLGVRGKKNTTIKN
ncbi:4Fe-4S binding protein [Clostridium phoceensis]|uniref:4Fe-4S binding protein n=1 Tax=Clostridium phoceensis TaxID=1650661 RepID=UPI0039AEBAFE